jgi:hypothetical protein
MQVMALTLPLQQLQAPVAVVVPMAVPTTQEPLVVLVVVVPKVAVAVPELLIKV